MARPKGTKNIETPERMWELFTEYRQWCKDNPLLEHDYVGAKAYEVHRHKRRCLTLEGFENYVFELGIIGDLGHYFSNLNGAYEDYLAICSRIRMIIRQDQIEGGMAGIYNPSITQRLNGLVEKSETRTIEQPLFPDVPTDNSGK